ncbi:MAG: nucleotidyl transferase AbiEii/AbiGii toxin family protein [Crocinitomicaceae bacterium]|nr:nucleotidyl transferase AbiEii/AbiGii toxin family protein [Crocinitomicaceae bacterium]
MISKEEIELKAKEFDIHTSNVQRDYIFGWILSGIYNASELKDHLILKGGNCFRKAYFENTRYSSDLDFSIESELTNEFIQSELNKVCDYIEAKTDISFYKERNTVKEALTIDEERTVHEARVYFNDFYGHESSIVIRVKLDITQFDRVYLPVQKRKIIHPYSDINECQTEIVCVKLEELLASKLKCLLQRRQSGDLYDLVRSLIIRDLNVDVSKTEIAKTVLQMTIFERNPSALKGLLLDLPIQLFKTIWKEQVCPKDSRVPFEDALENFNVFVEELFPGYGASQIDSTFFPSYQRNPILEAGSKGTMLELRYSGVTRLVEPYSLSFKKKVNGIAREYFYAYDTTGGVNSGEGLKTFLPDRIQSISVSEIEFTPRFEIELSKSVENSNVGYFSKPSGKKKLGYQRMSVSKFKIQCPACNRQFPRTTRSTKLSEHKDTYGNQCYGKQGFFV